MEFKGVVSKEFYKPFQRNSTENGFLWKSMETFPWNSMEVHGEISVEFHGMFPWKFCPNPLSNAMEMHGQISLEFHRNQCLNPPWNFFPYVKIFIDHTKLK